MTILWRRAFRYSQTYFLLVGAGLGYLALLIFTRFQPIAILLGGLITLAMMTSWFWQFRQTQMPTTGNVLDRNLFLARLDAIAAKALKTGNAPAWREAYQWAKASHEAATQIAERDPTLMPDVVETLVTVEALTTQVAGAYEAIDQVQTETYRSLTQQHLRESRDRLRDTHDQLQQLRDQIVLAQLTQEASADSGSLPRRLQLLIDANKTALHPPEEPPAQ